MSRFIDAISWDAQTVTLILFGLWPSGDEGDPLTPQGVTPPGEIRRYQLEDTEVSVSDYRCTELDLVFLDVPDDLERVIVMWLRAARQSGAVVAWFGFEGSFDFEHLLAADVANQVFAVADASGVSTALNDAERESQAWVARLAEARIHSGL
ncbi:MAG: hypothetical protein ABIR39_02000 [Nocardioides sp.]|uniref:hypothetical protein n=1 Tax=Nocardioides sp. TaxID=35761 RepID=UPI00326452EE